jgi:hypothetical protein
VRVLVSAIIDDLEHPEVPIEELPTITLVTPSENDQYYVSPFTALMHKELWHFIEEIDKEELRGVTDRFLQHMDTILPEPEHAPEHVVPGMLPATEYQADRDYKVCYPQYAGLLIRMWLNAHEYPNMIIAAGKNFAGFDRPFLDIVSQGPRAVKLKFAHRCLDPGTLYTLPTDEKPPSLQDCLDRAGIKQTVQHEAMDDARAVCRVLRAKLS